MLSELYPGSEITMMPTKPTITAIHLYNPTFSFKKNIERIVVNIGAANVILTTVARGSFLKAIKIATIAIKPAKHLLKCRNGLLVL